VINILQQIVEKFISEVTGFFGQDKVLTLEEIQTTLTPISIKSNIVCKIPLVMAATL